MSSKTIFMAKLDGSFERKLRAAYMAGFRDGREDGGASESGFYIYTPEEIENLFQSWLADPNEHNGQTWKFDC